MFIYRIIIMCGLITSIAITYVHQRVEIIKLGYGLQENRMYISQLVDQNSKLMYNLSKLESPSNLLTSLKTEKIEFANHRTEIDNSYLLVYAGPENGSAVENLIGRLLDLFTVKAEAKPRS